MDFPRFAAMMSYWEEQPPIHVQLKRLSIWFGMEEPGPKHGARIEDQTNDPFAAMIAASSSGQL